MFKIFAWLQEISSVVRKHSRIFNLMLLHVFCLIQCTICSLWGQSASKRMKRHRRPSPTSYIDNLPHKPPPPPHVHVLVCGIKIGESDRVGSFSSETHTSVCVFTPPPHHFITFSLMNSQMILVISSPSISTTGWATLMRLSASVSHTYKRVQLKPAFHSRQNVYSFTAQRLLSIAQETTAKLGGKKRFCFEAICRDQL